MTKNLHALIDPMSMILSGSAYRIWVEIHHPHELRPEDVQKAWSSMSADEQRSALDRARTLAGYVKAVEEAHSALSTVS